MLSFLAIYLVLQIAKSQVCIMGRVDDNNLNIGLNGDYGNDGLFNGEGSYTKTTDCTSLNEIYLYFAGSQWRIAASKGASQWTAQCDEASIDDCTAGKWKVAGSSGLETDSNMFAQSGSCPFWDCASVTSAVTGTGNINCQSFDTQVGPNTYKNDQNMYWYFNPIYQSWVCVNGTKYDYESCSAQFNAATVSGWEDLSGGNSLDIEYDIPSSNTFTVSCIGSSIPSPTGSPTTSVDSKAVITISMYAILLSIIVSVIV